MSARTINRLTRILDTTTPALVVLALVSFTLGLYCAYQGYDLNGFAVDAAGFALLTTATANLTSHDPTH